MSAYAMIAASELEFRIVGCVLPEKELKLLRQGLSFPDELLEILVSETNATSLISQAWRQIIADLTSLGLAHANYRRKVGSRHRSRQDD